MIGTLEQIQQRFQKGKIYMYRNNYAVPIDYEQNKYGEWMIRCKVESYPSPKEMLINADHLTEKQNTHLFG